MIMYGIKRLILGVVAACALLGGSFAQAAILSVTEFMGAPPQSVYFQAARMPAVTTSVVVVGSGSLQSSVFGATTGLVRISTDVACHILIDTNPTATTSSMYLAAGQTEYFVVSPGQRVAVIEAASP